MSYQSRSIFSIIAFSLAISTMNAKDLKISQKKLLKGDWCVVSTKDAAVLCTLMAHFSKKARVDVEEVVYEDNGPNFRGKYSIKGSTVK